MTIFVGMLCLFYVYRGLDAVSQNLKTLDEAEVPFSTAAFEMEVNSEEYASGVLRYLTDPSPKYRAEAEDDRQDFSRYHAEYARRSRSEEERRLGNEIGLKHKQLVAMGGMLKRTRDEQEIAFAKTIDLLEEIDEIADGGLAAAASREEPARSRALTAAADIEGEAAEIGFWLATYRHRPSPLARQRVHEKMTEFSSALSSYGALPLNAGERRQKARVESVYNRLAASVIDQLAAEDRIERALARFLALQDSIDDLLDERIQNLALNRLVEPRQAADKTAQGVLETLPYLIAFFVFVALAGGTLLILMIVRPLRRLTIGTQAIGEGNLGHRIEERGGDEFERVAAQFNQMVVRLQETTVSKEELEVSDRKLRETVADLEKLIAERERTERDKEKLQATLRRSEAMAAMGALTAGVAHEVRNPLFGITSTLDAMEAQPEESGARKPYQDVLRREVERLNKLMHDLLEFGRPAPLSLTKGNLTGVIAEAIRICSQYAEASKIGIIDETAESCGLLLLDKGRLTQVFVNLIQNAIQHAPAGTNVTINTWEHEDKRGNSWIDCSVGDSGEGFAPADLPLIFDPFFTRRRKGTGLGLSIVQRIVHEHGGEVVASNRSGGGAIVTVSLPADGPDQ